MHMRMQPNPKEKDNRHFRRDARGFRTPGKGGLYDAYVLLNRIAHPVLYF